MTSSSFIVAALRTLIASRNGALREVEIHELAAPVVQAVLSDANISATDVDEFILGNALGAGGNPARLASLLAGLLENLSADFRSTGSAVAALMPCFSPTPLSKAGMRKSF